MVFRALLGVLLPCLPTGRKPELPTNSYLGDATPKVQCVPTNVDGLFCSGVFTCAKLGQALIAANHFCQKGIFLRIKEPKYFKSMARSKFLSRLLFVVAYLFVFSFSSNAGVVVLNGLTHLHDVVPGETYRGSIEIQNTNDGEQPVKIYQRDYSFNFKGEAFYDEPGTNDRTNTAWIDISPKYIVLRAKEKATISYEIKVPEDGSLTGTFWSVLMVEGEKPVDANNLENGLTIQTQLRYAIQIATTFQTEGVRNLTFYDAKISQEDGIRYLAVDIQNEGEFLFKPDVSVELFNEQGKSIGIFNSTKKKLYPNTSARFIFELIGVESGDYQTLIMADCDEEDVFGINLDLVISDD